MRDVLNPGVEVSGVEGSKTEEPAVGGSDINEVEELEVEVYRLYDFQLDQSSEALIQSFHFYCPAATAFEPLDAGLHLVR
jgi:hypothetical protein